jgi:multicomponent Na+:H+ antiporter subunit G
MTGEIIISVFVLLGSFLILIAGIGVVRMPDLYMRMHAATKAPSMGFMLTLIGLMIYSPTLVVLLKSIAIILFLYITMPVSASLLGKSSLDMNLPQWRRNKQKEERAGR